MAESRQQLLAGNFEANPPNAVQLDLREDLGFPLKIKVAEIRDIKKRQGAHSPQAISLPGTETNNRFFGGVYDIGADFEIFNPNKKVGCKFIIDGEEVINGFLQLKSVKSNTRGDIVYNISIFDQVSSFYREVKDKLVADIDFSDLNHTLDASAINASWFGNWETVGFYYPLLKDADTNGIRKVEKFQPAIYKKQILDRIVKQAHPDYPLKEFTWSGTLKTDAIFEREVIPYAGDKPTISESEAAAKAAFVGRSTSIVVKDVNPAPSNGYSLGYETVTPLAFNDETTAPFDDSNNLFDGTVFTAPVDGLYKFDANLGFSCQVDYTTSGSDDKDSELRISLVGGLEIRDLSNNLINGFNSSAQPYEIKATPGNNQHSTNQAASVFAVKLTQTTDGSHVAGVFNPLPSVKGDFQGVEDEGTIYMRAGWTARLNFRFQLQGHRFIGETGINPDLNINRVQFFLQSGSHFRSQKIQTGYVANNTVQMNRFVNPTLKQREILEDIVSTHNCFIYTNPENENDIVFDIRDDFFNSGPTFDWTDKRDNSSREEIKMIGELQSEEFLFTYKKASDASNKVYSDLVGGDIYGQYRFLFSNEFVKGQKKIETPFEATPFIRQVLDIPATNGLTANFSTALVPSIDVTSPKTGFRTLYARQGLLTDDVSVNQDGGETVKFVIKGKDPVTGLDDFVEVTGYPYAGHYDHPINPTFSLNFGNPEVVLAEMPASNAGTWTPTPNTIFQRRWLNTMQQISKGQMLKDEFSLSSEDVALVRRNPNCKVFIENQYYFVNEILFEGNQNLTKLARVELITVEGSLTIPSEPLEYEGSYNDSGVNIFNPPGTTTGTSSKDETVNSGNTSGKDTENILVRGRGNNTGAGTKNATITGNDNQVNSGVKNATIENGDNNTVDADNVTIRNRDNLTVETEGLTIDGNAIILDGKIGTFFNKIDGGFNTLRPFNSRYKENYLEGGDNEVQNTFSDSVVNKIDSDNGITEKI